METTIITRKIQLIPTEKEFRQYIMKLESMCFRGANLIMNHQNFNDYFGDRIMIGDVEMKQKGDKIGREIDTISESIRQERAKKSPDKAEIDKLIKKKDKKFKMQNSLTSEARVKAEELYACSTKNSTYQLLGKTYPQIPSGIRATLNSEVVKYYDKIKFEIKHGRMSLPTYKKGYPIPFQTKAMRLNAEGDEIILNWFEKSSFKLYFGRDRSNNKVIVERVLDGTYKACDSKIMVSYKMNKPDKIFLLLVVKMPKRQRNLDENKALGVNLGIINPVFCSVEGKKHGKPIGTIDEFMRVRTQMQARLKNLQENMRYRNGGKGRKKKTKAIDQFKDKERNFVKNYNHNLSRAVIDYAIQQECGVIKMELLEGFGKDVDKFKERLFLRNWSYFELHNFIQYKAKHEGIKVLFVDPFKISQTCCECGEEGELSKDFRHFTCKNKKCKKHGVKAYSDYNASQNNAKSDKIITKKEQSEFYKQQKQKKQSA